MFASKVMVDRGKLSWEFLDRSFEDWSIEIVFKDVQMAPIEIDLH